MKAKFCVQVFDKVQYIFVAVSVATVLERFKVKVKIKAHDIESRLFQDQVRSCLKAPLITSKKGISLLHVFFCLVNARKFCFHVCQNRPQFEQ